MCRICCVPFCPSKSGTVGISFHEIPSNNEVRLQWLNVISRADSSNLNQSWQPGSRSAVCSLHFTKDDYLLDHKQKRLKKDAVPSVFPHYPVYKLVIVKPTRKLPIDRTSVPRPLKRQKRS